MLIKTKAIVLSSIKYGDQDLIVNCYTEEGLKAYMLKRILTSKNKNLSKAHFQPLNLLEITARHKNNYKLHSISEARIDFVYQSIHSNILKQSVVIFLAEVLISVLQEESKDLELFEFLLASFQWLDVHQRFGNFHLVFLLKLTQYLGFYPEVKNSDQPYFDLEEGMFTTKKSQYCIEDSNLMLFKTLIGTKFDGMEQLKLNVYSRQIILDILMDYYRLHIPGFKKPKSLEILKEIFK